MSRARSPETTGGNDREGMYVRKLEGKLTQVAFALAGSTLVGVLIAVGEAARKWSAG